MLSELKFAVRCLLKTPGFTLIAVLMLGVGIGSTTAIFSLVDTVLLRPLPYAQPERLARIYTEVPNPTGVLPRFRAATNEFLYLRREAKSWAALNAWRDGPANVVTAVEPMRINAAAVTGGLLESLGATPALGRALVAADDALGAPLVAVISYRLWQSAFGGQRAIVGRDLVLNGARYSIVGVMPEGFAFPVGDAASSDV
jgi:hypothetical protein